MIIFVNFQVYDFLTPPTAGLQMVSLKSELQIQVFLCANLRNKIYNDHILFLRSNTDVSPLQ